jgi:GNAT superfamily N-acetyltransferase
LSEDCIVRWFNEDDIESYIEGLNRALYDEYDKAVFEWKWKRNPVSVGFTSIAVVEHHLYGPMAFNSFLPMEIRRGEQVFKALQGCDGFVDKKHRRKGLFQKTLRFLEEEANEIDAEFLMGFNLVEAAGAARKAGSEIACDVNKCFLKPGLFRKISSDLKISLEPISVEVLHDMYMGWATSSRLFNLNRSLEYLMWRIEKHPFKEIQPYGVYLQDDLIGYIVTDKVTEGEKTTLTINDYNPELMNTHLRSIIENLNALYDDITVMEMDTIQGGELQRVARRLGFEVTPWYKVIMKALKGTEQREGAVFRGGLKLSNIHKWHLAESDIY